MKDIDPRIISIIKKANIAPQIFDLETHKKARAMSQRFSRAKWKLRDDDDDLAEIANALTFSVRGSTFVVERFSDPLEALIA